MLTHILVLSYVHEGGEWISLQRLITEVLRKNQNYFKFFLIGFCRKFKPKTEGFHSVVYIPRADNKNPFGFIKNLLSDFFNARNSILKSIEKYENIEVYWSTDFLMTLAAFSVNYVRKRKIVYHFHGLRSSILKKPTDYNYRQIMLKLLEYLAFMVSDYIVIPSKAAENYIKKIVGIFSKQEKYHLIRSSVPNQYFRKYSKNSILLFKKKFKINKFSQIILYSGRVTRYKGLENLLYAFSLFIRQYPNSILLVSYPKSSADYEILNSLRGKVELLKIKKNVKFMTQLSNKNLIKLYNVADVLVLASSIEMAPLVILESLACGTPCIGSNVGNVPEILSQINSNLIIKDNKYQNIFSTLNTFFALKKNELIEIKGKSKQLAYSYKTERAANEFLEFFNYIE